jgi:hypothetical protein
MHYCLTKDELSQLLSSISEGDEIESSVLIDRVQNARYWQDELCCFTYLLAILLERDDKSLSAKNQMINTLYLLDEQMMVKIQEFDLPFIEYMLRYLRCESLTLIEDLIRIDTQMSEHNYSNAIRG